MPVGYLMGQAKLEPERQRWARNSLRLREAFYCDRDDLVFVPGGYAARPEAFTRWQYTQP